MHTCHSLRWLAAGVLSLGLTHCKGSDGSSNVQPDASAGRDASADVGTSSNADAAHPAEHDAAHPAEHDAAREPAHDAAVDAPADTAASCAAHTQKFVVNTLLLPEQRSDYAIDLNGDGKVDNQLGSIVGALMTNNLDLQGEMRAAVASGDALLLLDETSADPAFLLDPSCAHAGLQQAVPHPAPDFADAGTLVPDPTFRRGEFVGSIAGGAFASTEPATMTTPIELDVKLSIWGIVPFHLVGAHVSFTFSSGKITGGQLQGAVRNTELRDVVLPRIAETLSEAVQADASASSLQLQIFDIGGCLPTDVNFDGSPAAANDGKIAVCEVLGNVIIKNVFNPDVQMFDSSGNYHPNPANTVRDSLSVGLGFTAVPARF